MPEQQPTPPMVDRNSLETTFSKYNADTINQPSLPNTPFQGLSHPDPDSIFGTSKPMSPIEEAEAKIFSNNKKDSFTGGSRLFPVSDLTNGRYSAYNPDPSYDNEDAYASSQSWLDKAGNGVAKMLGLATTTAISSSLGLINGAVQWANTGKFSSFYDNDFTKSLDEFNKQLEDRFPHYQTSKERSSDWYEPANLFTANFLFDNIIKNLGFALGAAIPAGALGKALQSVRLSSRLFAAGEAIQATEAIEAASQLPRLQQLSTIGEKLRFVAGGAVKSLGAQSVNGQEAAGFLVKGLSSVLSSSGEASLEAYNNLNEFRNNKIAEYKAKNGYEPIGADLDKINEDASHVGNWSFGLNMALLSGTEYVQLPKIFSSTFAGERALLNNIEKDAVTGLYKSALPESGIFKKLYKTKNFASLFFNAPEAFEEGAQFGIQKGTQDYYNKKYRGEDADFISSFGEGIRQGFFTSEGLENTVLGGLSGALMTSGFISKQGFGKSGKIAERGWTGYGGERAENTEQLTSGLNKYRFQEYLKDGVEQANRAVALQQERERAIRQGDILESKDLEFDYSHNYLAHRIKWDRYDLVKEDIQGMLQEAATQEGFERLQAQGRAAQTDTQQSFIARINNFAQHVESVKNNYDRLNNKYGLVKDNNGNKKYTPEVIDQMVYAAAKVEDYNKRIPQLAQELSQKGIDVQTVLSNLIEDEKTSIQSTREALKQINSLNDISEVKDDLKQKLQDVIELSQRRQSFIKDFDDIKNNPADYKDVINKSAPQNIASISQPNKTKKEVEVGKEYSISSPGLFRDGNNLSINPKINVLSQTLGGEYEVKLPDGSITYVKPSQFKDYEISDPYENSPELNDAINKVVDKEVEAKGLSSLFEASTPLEEKLSIINSLNNKTLVDAIQRGVKKETAEIVKKLEELKQQKEKFKKDVELQKKFYSTVLSLDGEENTEDPEAKEDVDMSPKKDLSIIASTGTSQRYEDAAPDSPARREQTLLLNLSRKKELADADIKAVLVTKNTQVALGLNGIIDPAYPDAIRIVYVETDKDGSFFYLDKEGNPMPFGQIDLDTIAYGTMHDESLTFGGGQTSYTNKRDLDEKTVKENYKKFREQVLSITDAQMRANPTSFFTPFIVSRGLPNVANSSSQNSLLDVNLISKEDLFTPIVTIPTTGKTVYGPENESVNMPKGKPLYNYRGNLFFLNNRNLTEKEAKNVRDVLLYAINQLKEKGEVSKQLENYLRGVLYFKTPSGNKVSRNQVYFQDDKLFIGDKGQSFDIFNINPEELLTVLKGIYIYVDNRHLLEFAKNPQNTPFEELTISNDGQLLVKKVWPSYQHYLLEKREDGSPAPLTTNIITPTSADELPIIQKYPILQLEALSTKNLVPSVKETKKIEKEAASKAPAKEITKGIVYDGKTINTVPTSKGEPISFTVTAEGAITIIKDDSSDAVYDRLVKAGKTPEEAKTLIGGVASNAIVKDKQGKQSKEEIEKEQDKLAQKKVEAPEPKEEKKALPKIEPAVSSEVKEGSLTRKIKKELNTDNNLNDSEKDLLRNLSSKVDMSVEDAVNEFAGYKRNDYIYINKLLREGKPITEENIKKEKPSSLSPDIEKQSYDKIRNILDNTEFRPSKQTSLYRTIFNESGDFLNKYKVGDEFTDKGITSTTIDKDWANNDTKTPLVIYELNKGDKINGFYVAGVEKEFLIKPDTNFTVTEVGSVDGRKFIKVKPSENKQSKKEDKPSRFKPGNFDNSAKRLDLKPFTLIGDTTKEEEEVKKMLPQVDIVSLKNVINITGGGKAWGAALPHFIYVWENAPYGTRFHEAFEQVFNFILSTKQQKELYNEFKQRQGSFTTFENKTKPYSEATFVEAKEQLADEFAEFKDSGKLPQAPKAKSFLQKVWEFLKALFTGKPFSVEEAFYKLAKGGYADAIISAPMAVEPQYKRTVVNTPEALVQDTISGMAAELFMKKWNDDAALINQLEEEEEEATKTLFQQLFDGLSRYFEEDGDNTLSSLFYQESITYPDRENQLYETYQKVQENWNNVKAQWGNYMEDLKSFLKVFDIAFTVNDDGEIELNNDVDNKEERSQAEYNSDDRLFVNAKNSASKIVKLLFATIADSEYIFEITKNALGNVTEEYKSNQIKRNGNQMILPSLAPYARLFNYTLHNAANVNGIENIISKLRGTTNNKNIKVNANLEVLLNRIGYDKVDPITRQVQNIGWEGLSAPSRKILLKLENALSKQKPQFFVQYSPSKREHRILATNISDRTEQLKDMWIDNIKGSAHTVASQNRIKFKPSVASDDDFVLLSNLNIPFTESDFKKLSKGNKQLFKTTLSAIREDVKTYINKYFPVDTKATNIGFSGRLTILAELYAQNIEGDTTESQHFNAAGKPTSSFILNNYVSFILNDTYKVKTLEEFKQLNPQYNDLYMGDSYILNNLLFQDGQKTNYEIAVAISEGRRAKEGGTPISKLTYGERLIYEINNNFNDIYYMLLPADSSTEWGLKIRNIISPARWFKGDKEAQLEEYSRLMWSSLLNEIELAKDFNTNPTRNSLAALNQQEGSRKVGASLRFFKSVLTKDLVEDIHDLIDNEGNLDESIYPQFKQQLTDFVKSRAEATITNLKSYQLINTKDGNSELAGIDTDFLKRNFDKTFLSEEQLNDLFFFREANYIFNNIEMHKFLFNDPAQYKDEEKRVKSFLSGREYSNQSEDLNKINDVEFNKSGDYVLKPNEFGYKVHSNKINVQTVATVKTTSSNIEEIEKALPGAAGKKYRDNDAADAQSWASPSTYVEMLYKAGGRLTTKQQQLHQWLMAYQRSKMLEKGLLSEENCSKELQAADNKLLKSTIPDASMHIIKPIVSGVRLENGTAIQYLYKTSTAPLYYYFVENTPAEEILLSMQKNNIGMLAMDSAHKVGGIKSKTSKLYNDEGKISEDFATSSVEVDYKYFGIQVETSGTKDYQTQGSQLTKLAVQNLMSNGMPIDYKGTPQQWYQETNKEKASPVYALVKKHNDLLSRMAVLRANKLLDKLGIKKGEFGYTYEDRKKVADFILSELTRRELPTNMGVGIEVENNEFKSPLESNVNYKKIKELLWSVIENNITKPKVSGGPKILLSALGFDNYKKETINGKEVLTSSKYKFYTQKDGKTQACQIALPFVFGTNLLYKIEKSQGIKFSSQKEGMKHVLDYLNKTKEGKSLLEGIGFRIPTQGLNSVDFFEIVEFLPPQMGDAVIFPSEITTKAGSDFDVDKMNIYLKNFYIDGNGYPKAIPFFGADDKAMEKMKDFSLSVIAGQYVKADENAIENLNISKESEEDNGAEEFFIKSLENEYYSTIKDILALESNFARLITPNDAKQLKTISENIEDLKPTSNNKYPLTNATRFIDSSFVSNKRHLFLIMKQAVGVAAVANTNLALNQVANFYMTIPSYWKKQNFNVRFKYNNASTGTLSLSQTQNKFGDWISDLHSQAIDGTVDVAKDEWLANLLGSPEAFSPLLYMFKLGISPKTAALFINQPAIQQYLKLKGIHQNVSKITRWVKPKFNKFIENDIRKAYGLNAKQIKAAIANKPNIYSDEEMENAIKSPYTANATLQVQMLNDYRGFEAMAKDLFTNVQGYNWDTSRFTSPEIVLDKQLQYQTAKTTFSLGSGVDRILNSSFIGDIKSSIEDVNLALSGLLNTQKGASKRILNKMAIKLGVQFFSKDNKVKYLQKAENSLIDYLTQTQSEFGGFKLSQLIPAMFLKENNIAALVDAIQSHPLIQDNPIVKNIQVVKDKREGYPSYLRLIEQDYDSYTANVWTAAFRELRDNNIMVDVNGQQRPVSTIYQYLLISQLLQNGSSRARGSFLHLIPNEDYAKLIDPVLKNIQNVEEWYNKDLFYRNNWMDDNLVPEAEMDLLDDGLTESLPVMSNKNLTEEFNKAGYGKIQLITQPEDKKNYTYIKITSFVKNSEGKIEDVTNKTVSLYRRVDEDENTPITVNSYNEQMGYNESKLVYTKVNKLGNENLKEYGDKSVLAQNPKIDEISNEQIIDAMTKVGVKFSNLFLTKLVSVDEFESAEEQEEAPEEQNDTIYDKLGNKTKSENIEFLNWADLKEYAAPIEKDSSGNIEAIVATRIYKAFNHFGNPFSSDKQVLAKNPDLIKTSSTKESVEKYIDWVINSQDKRAQWIREQLKSGKLKNKPILYYTELGEPSHATALDYLINKYNWETLSPEEGTEGIC